MHLICLCAYRWRCHRHPRVLEQSPPAPCQEAEREDGDDDGDVLHEQNDLAHDLSKHPGLRYIPDDCGWHAKDQPDQIRGHQTGQEVGRDRAEVATRAPPDYPQD